ncbi:hypothetical protein [Spirosoma sp. KUDC1026]|uniref:hypothetical protein n=1 Tax=Spirosoma sp. KUDC1026 TaxID=2745947 RepID=UPI00159BAB3C|nr:hypothetical protein [Spirosoma sp. KUDC1026]QKZ14635.1 hypothetical protein HU175_19190 [Spirosoma sp. KUDC1026]
MVSTRTHLAIWALCLLGISYASDVSAQTQTATLPPIVIKDKVFESVLSEYLKGERSKSLILAVFLERYDSDYTYTLHDFALYDEIKDNPTSTFGSWKGHTLLFYTGLEDVLTSIDTGKVSQINQFLRSRLPDGREETPTDVPNEVMLTVITHDPKIWRFKVRDGKLLWLRRGLAYQSEKVPYMKY